MDIKTLSDEAIRKASYQVERSWRKRLHGCVGLFSDPQQKAFVAEEVLSLVLTYADAEKVEGRVWVSATDIAAIYRQALERLCLNG